MPLDTAFATCPKGHPMSWNEALQCWVCYACEEAASFRLPKSDDVRHCQNLMIAAIKAGNRPAAHFWAMCAASYRQRDALAALTNEAADWVDRGGWTAPRSTRLRNG